MKASNQQQNNFFIRGIASVAIIAPSLLVIAASTMPEGLARGDLIVYGHGVVLAVLATALVLRAVHTSDFSKAFKIVVSEPKYFATA